MAGPGRYQTYRSQRLCRVVVFAIVCILALVGFVSLVIWLAIRPTELVYSVDDGKVQGFDLRNNHLNASFDFIINAQNPNHRVSVYYDSMEVYVNYDGQRIAFATVEPFFQPRHNITRFEVKPMVQAVPLTESASKSLMVEKSSGEIKLKVRVRAKIRFKVGLWKSSHYTLRVYCSPVEVHLDPSRAFERKYCDADT